MCHAIEHIKNKYISMGESQFIFHLNVKRNIKPKKLFFLLRK